MVAAVFSVGAAVATAAVGTATAAVAGPVLGSLASAAAGATLSFLAPGLTGGGAAPTKGGFSLPEPPEPATLPDLPTRTPVANFGIPPAAERTPVRRTQMLIEPITAHKVIYGRTRVGGPLVFAHARAPAGSGTLDHLHLVVVHAAHPVDAIEQLYLNDKPVGALDGDGQATEPPWYGEPKDGGGTVPHVRVRTHLGGPDQAADAELVAESDGRWTTQHRLRGRAYSYVRLLYNGDIFRTGIPNVSAIVRGRTVFDPRADVTEWTDNAALCILDYLRQPFGLGAADDEIDWDSFIAAATICDESVDTFGGTEFRYSCNGIVDLADPPVVILENLLTSCAGRLSYVGGRWRLQAGAWTAPLLTLSETELRAPVTVRPRRSRRRLVNTVRGVFLSPAHNWQATDFPPVSNPAYLATDGGEVSQTLDLPFTIAPGAAQRIARIALESNRREMRISFPANLTGLRLAAGDTVLVSLARFGLAEAPFRVDSWSLTEDMGVDLELSADDADVYAHALENLKEMS